MRKMWLIFCVFTAAAAGWILYDSMVVGLYFQDRRQGVFLLAAGIGLCVFYAWSVYMTGRGKRRLELEKDLVWRENRRELWMTGVSAGAAAAGLGVYFLRYQEAVRILFCAVLIFGWTLGAAFLIPVIKTVRELPEKEFCMQIRAEQRKQGDSTARQKPGESETGQCTLREEENAREMISELVGIYNDHAACQVLFCTYLFWQIVVRAQDIGKNPWGVLLLVPAVPVGFLLLEVWKNYRREQRLKQLSLWLEKKRPQAVLRFFEIYYETAAYRAEMLPGRIRCAAAEAMQMQGE